MSSLKDLASLIMIPSLYKDGRLDTVKPLGNSIIHPDATGNNDGTDGTTPAEGNFTFSRGSNLAATRVDVNGLIEKGRENLLLQSNQFDTTWLQTNTTLTSGQSGYNGNDAWKVASASGGQTGMQQNISFSNIHTFSIYAKAGSVDFLKLFVVQSGTNRNCVIDLSDGSIASEVKANSSPEASVTSLANGWYRIEMPTNANSATFVRIRPHLSVSDENLSVGDFIYIQDAQLEAGLVATDYIETGASTAQAGILEDMPRLDYSGSCPALLLEPSRTNKNNQSEYFGGWTANTTITANADISPEGVRNAYNIASNSGVGNGILKIIGVLSSTQYVCSIYVKSAGATTGKLRLFDGSTGASTTTTFTPTSEWQRVEVTRTSGSSTFQFRVDIHSNDGDLLIYGAQLEAGSYPTSYIPTYGSSVTRSKDVCKNTSAANLIGQTEGVIFVEFDKKNGTAERRFFLQIGSGSTTIYARLESNNSLTTQILNGGTDYLTSTGTIIPSGNNKFAVAYANNDAVFYLNGTQLASSSSVVVPALSDLYIGSNSSTSQTIAGEIKQALLFKTRLTNAELAALTTI